MSENRKSWQHHTWTTTNSWSWDTAASFRQDLSFFPPLTSPWPPSFINIIHPGPVGISIFGFHPRLPHLTILLWIRRQFNMELINFTGLLENKLVKYLPGKRKEFFEKYRGSPPCLFQSFPSWLLHVSDVCWHYH